MTSYTAATPTRRDQVVRVAIAACLAITAAIAYTTNVDLPIVPREWQLWVVGFVVLTLIPAVLCGVITGAVCVGRGWTPHLVVAVLVALAVVTVSARAYAEQNLPIPVASYLVASAWWIGIQFVTGWASSWILARVLGRDRLRPQTTG